MFFYTLANIVDVIGVKTLSFQYVYLPEHVTLDTCKFKQNFEKKNASLDVLYNKTFDIIW